jgi:hypothetical protein
LEAVEVVNRINLDNLVDLAAETVLTAMERVLVDLVHQVKVSLVELVLHHRMVLLEVAVVLVKQVKVDTTDRTLVQQEVATDIHLLSLVLRRLMVVVAVALTTLAVLIILMVDLVVVE